MIKAGIFLTVIWFAVFGLCDPGQAWAQEGVANDSSIASGTTNEEFFGELPGDTEGAETPSAGQEAGETEEDEALPAAGDELPVLPEIEPTGELPSEVTEEVPAAPASSPGVEPVEEVGDTSLTPPEPTAGTPAFGASSNSPETPDIAPDVVDEAAPVSNPLETSSAGEDDEAEPPVDSEATAPAEVTGGEGQQGNTLWSNLSFLGGKKEEQAVAEGGTEASPASTEPTNPPGNLLRRLTGEEGATGAKGGAEDEKAATYIDPNQAKIIELKRLAISSYEKGRVQDSIRFINDLITMQPYEADFHFALGLCYRSQKKYKEALKKFQDVLDLGGPKSLIALLRAEAFAFQCSLVPPGSPEREQKQAKVFETLKEAAVGGRNIIADVHNLPLLNSYQHDTNFIKLALQLERFEVSQGRRFDPFTNVFDMKTPGTEVAEGQGSDDEPTELTPSDQAKLLREAKTLFERITFYIRLQDEDKAMRAYLRLKEMVNKQKLITVPRIEKDFRDVLARLPDIEVQITGIRLRYYYNQAQEKLGRMKDVFEDGDYARVQKLHVELEALAREMIAANRKYESVAREILQRSKVWVSRAQIRLEFETQKPTIQGIIISGDGKMTILNGKIVKQGESLGNFRVVRIESNRVSFQYKGEEIPMVFRRY